MNRIDEHDLLALGYGIRVFKWDDGNVSGIGVQFENAWVKDGIFASGTFGRGNNFYDALNDYYQQIKGKTLLIGLDPETRSEVKVI